MTIAINESVIEGGPLPEGDLCAYSYDPITSCVYLTRLLDEPPPTVISTKSFVATMGTNFALTIANIVLYKGIIKLKYTSSINSLVGQIRLTNNAGIVIFDTPLYSSNNFDTSLLNINTFGFKLNDFDTYTLVITPDTTAGANIQLLELELPTGANTTTVYNGNFSQTPAITGISSWRDFEVTVSNYNPLNTSWGYIRKFGRHLVTHTLAPFPPPFFDTDWHNPVDYSENSSYIFNSVTNFAQPFFSSETFNSTPDLSKVVRIMDDIYARPTPTCYSIALVTQEDAGHQLLWRCIRQTRILTIAGHGDFTYYINTWVSSEKVYKYKAGGIYFGGKDYSGPLNSILVDSQDGLNYSEYKILDLNEFPVNSNNELYVDAYTCNYSSTSSKVYCVLNKSTGRMAEIDAVAKTVKYFTVVVPIDSTICQLYYTNRLMYTVKSADNTVFSLYDANNNGILLYTFDLGTYQPQVPTQFTIIN